MTRFLPGKQLFGLLLLCLSVCNTNGLKQIHREASVEAVHQNSRKLQTNFTLYNYNTTATYNFDFDLVVAPNTPPSTTQVQELLRRTGIYLTRSTSSVYPIAFQGLQLVYHSLQWEAVDDVTNRLIVNFETRVSFRSVGDYEQKLEVPDTDQVLNAIVQIDQDFFLANFVRSVDPQEVFQKATSVVVIGESMDYVPTPTESPEDASMVDDTEGQFPQTATQTPQTAAESASSIGSSLSDPNNDTPSNNNLGYPEDQNQDSAQEDSITPAGEKPCLIADFSTNADGHVIVNRNNPMTFEKEVETQETLITKLLSYQLTATNMFYYFLVACVLHWAAKYGLNKWSPAYKQSNKQLQLETYSVQLAVFTPLLPFLIWATVLIRSDHWDCVIKGLKVFSHIAMILLAITGVDVLVRGYDMSRLLMAQKVTVVVSMLYVISGNYHGLKEPLDQFSFGIIEAFGALAVQPSLIAMIYYRGWSDSSLEEKELTRSKVGSVMRVGVALGFILKAALVVASAWWYIVHVGHLAGSSLIWFLPIIRSVDTLVSACSLQVQYSLYKKVVWGNLGTSKQVEPTEKGSDHAGSDDGDHGEDARFHCDGSDRGEAQYESQASV